MERTNWIRLELPNWKHLGRFVLWSGGRVILSAWLFSLYGTTVLCKILINVAEQTKQATLRLVKIYDQLPYMGVAVQNIIDVPSTEVNEPQEIITDIISAIAEKQLMIIGNSGAGKSTVAQYLAYTVGGKVRVLECEGTPDDWIGLEVIGRGEDWGAIDAAMQAESEELSRRILIRNEQGDKALIGTDEVTIVEEYPEVTQKCDSATDWFERHGRRGRKAKRFIICLSQYDRVSAWGLEGKSDLGDCFYRLRLSKTAVNHAKSLKDDALVAWLRADRSHCLLDDQPCKLPSYREMKAVTTRLQLSPGNSTQVTPETTVQQGFQAIITAETAPSEATIRAAKACLGAGFSDSKVIKEILGYQGAQYQKGKELLEQIKKS
jgi:energy-coupling factor transporter ATP-binding protein EcfA2